MRIVLGISIVIFWAAMTATFFEEHILPDIELQAELCYRTALVKQLKADEYTMKILFLNQKVGESRTSIEPSNDGGCSISNVTQMAFPELGDAGTMSMEMVSRLDSSFRLRSVTMTVKSAIMNARIVGTASQNSLRLTFRTQDGTTDADIPLTGHETLSDGLSPFINMPHLAVGKEWDIFMIDPLTLTSCRRRARVEEMETIQWRGEDCETFLVTLEVSKTQKIRAWIDREGRVLREEIGPGLALERE
ncbi:MAG: hypothetical protein RDV41_11535 [Planctomycetota bacterium]|nr:hypothetical protein [Planctomycetota bacterium]